MAKTVVGLFDSYSEAQHVVQDLIDGGFRREDISIVSNDSSHSADRERMAGTSTAGTTTDESAAAEGAGTGAVSGTVLGGALGLLVGAGLLAIPGIGPVLAAGPLAAGIGTVAATVGAGALGAGIGAATGGLMGGLVGSGVPKEDAEYYTEGVRRGGTLVTVTAEDTMAGMAYDVLQRHNAIDIDERSAQWRSSGWTGSDNQTESLDRSSTMSDSNPMGSSSSMSGTASGNTALRSEQMTGDERGLPVVEEEIDIDKRRVDTGGVRVNTTVEERPVEEQVSLREERVNVERRPADRPVTDGDTAAFQERSFEMRESTEEPVVHKRARVVEEVTINKDVRDRTETISDTVRRTDVSVERGDTVSTGSTGMESAAGMGSSYDTYDSDYRDHYQRTFSSAGYSYDDYKPVYQYGYSLAGDQRYSGSDWSSVETDARTRWEEHNPGTWEQFKDSIQYAWDKARGKR